MPEGCVLMDCDIAILVPCYNEEKTIVNVLKDFITVFDGYDFKIYVYDNNSTDKTFEIASSTNCSNVICKKEFRQGKGFVIRDFFQNVDANCYIMIDGDDTYPVADSLKMVNLVQNEGYDMVIGDRLSTDYHRVNTRRFHSLGNTLVSKLINIFFCSNIVDIMTGLRVFSRKFVKTAGLLAQGFEVETEMTILALDGNYKIKEVPITYKERIEGSYSKLNTFKDGFKVLRTIFTLFKDYKPLEFFIFFAIVFAFLSILLFIPIFLEYLNTGLVERFPTLFVSIFFALLSTLSICVGVILSTITKMFRRNKEIYQINFK